MPPLTHEQLTSAAAQLAQVVQSNWGQLGLGPLPGNGGEEEEEDSEEDEEDPISPPASSLPLPPTTSKKSKKKKKKPPPPPPSQQLPYQPIAGPSSEREKIRDFWLSLKEGERRDLVKLEKDDVVRKMKDVQKSGNGGCGCAVCGRKRWVNFSLSPAAFNSMFSY